MAWTPPNDESPLVDCSLEVRNGVRFDLWVDAKQVCYGRTKTFAVSDAWETVRVGRGSISRVELVKKSPWALRIVGLVLIGATTAGVAAFMLGAVDTFHFASLIGYVLGGACFVGTGNRWQLSFFDGKKNHKLVQPVASKKETMHAMAKALEETARLLKQSAGEEFRRALTREA